MTELKNSEVPENKSRKRKRLPYKDNKSRLKKSVEIGGGQFTLIKDVIPQKVTKVKRVLPDWILNPIPIKKNLKEGKPPKEVCPTLRLEICKCLRENNITNLFPVQQVVIPYILSGAHGVEYRFPPRDVCVATPTGSGKTLSFVIPIVQALGERTLFHTLSAVVILPVIELAQQVFKVFKTYGSVLNLMVGKAFRGENFQTEQEQLVHQVYDEFYSKVDILVATPGRLLEHITKTPGLDFAQVRFLVLDEADKLLAGENGDIISRILSYISQFKYKPLNLGLPPFLPLKARVNPDILSCLSETSSYTIGPSAKTNLQKSFFSRPFQETIKSDDESKDEYFPVPCPPLQRLLFSATLTHDPQQLQNVSLFRPILFTTDAGDGVEKAETVLEEPVKPAELTEQWVKTEINVKPLVLHHILCKEQKKKEQFRGLVFAGSVELSAKLTSLLKALSEGKYVVEEFVSIHSRQRKERIARFLKGKTNVLVASDAMARGFDVPDIDCVISYDVPSVLTYTHRVGRTARAGKPGKAISIVTEDELKNLKKLFGKNLSNISERIVKEEKLQKYETLFRGALENLSHTLQKKSQEGIIRKTLKRKGKGKLGKNVRGKLK